MKRMWILLMFASQLFVSAAFAADYEREKRWADEVVPGIVVGDAIYLKQANKHEFLALYTPAKNANTALVIVHGLGIHPDWGLIGVLRSRLADLGYTTLSIQMPVLANEAKAKDYEATIPESVERMRLAVDFLKGKGYSSIAIASHSLGSRMNYGYITSGFDPAVRSVVVIGMAADADFSVLKLPLLDLYGERDFPEVLTNAAKRKQALAGKPGTRQQMVPGADHFFEGQDDALVAAVSGYLKETLGK